MKDILESEETFTAYATIDCSMHMLQELLKDLQKPLSPIEILIDVAVQANKEKAKQAIELLDILIENKKIIGAYNGTEDILKKRVQELVDKY